MSFILSFIIISITSFTLFCLYCGVNVILEKLKKDGLRSVIEMSVLIFIITAVLLMLTNKMSDSFVPDQGAQIRSYRV